MDNNNMTEEELQEYESNKKNLIKLLKMESNLIYSLKNKEIEYKNKEEKLKEGKDNFEKIHDNFYKNNEDNNSIINLNLSEYQINIINHLEKKLDDLRKRVIDLENVIEECKDKNNQENLDKENLLFKDKIYDYIKENLIIEKYIQSENFKTSNELIISKKFNLGILEKEYDRLKNIKKDLVNNNNKLKIIESKNKKKISKFN